MNSSEANYKLEVFRMGWYGGPGARRMQAPVTLNGVQQPACANVETVAVKQPVDPGANINTTLLECDWSVSYTLNVPDTQTDPAATDYWASGTYLVKLTGSASTRQSYIIFTLRDDSRNADILFENAVTTYQAYNDWGGKSLYSYNSGGLPAYKVSFNRPYGGGGEGQFFLFELKTLRFLEREGYDVSYTTNIDSHVSGAQQLVPAKHKLFMSAGHDEYWTKQMRDNIEGARDQGVNLVFLAANTGYWQIRLEPSTAGSQPNRTVVGYKNANWDPLPNNTPVAETTTLFRAPVINRPEAALFGAMYDYSPVNADIVINNCPAWMCSGTTLVAGDKLIGLLGYEVDILHASTPPGTVEVARSPYDVGSGPNLTTRYSSMTYYTHSSGAQVFSTGSMNWNYGLDSRGDKPLLVNPDAQKITSNVLNRFASPPPVLMAGALAIRTTGGVMDKTAAPIAAGGGCAFGPTKSNLGDASILLILLTNLLWRLRRWQRPDRQRDGNSCRQ